MKEILEDMDKIEAVLDQICEKSDLLKDNILKFFEELETGMSANDFHGSTT